MSFTAILWYGILYNKDYPGNLTERKQTPEEALFVIFFSHKQAW
jgi:hypothetical protein